MQVKMKMKTHETMQCALDLTANARNGILKYVDREQAFFGSETSFDLYIEKRNENRQGNLSFSIYFDNSQNQNLAMLLNGRVAVMECVIKNEGFLATGFHVRGKREPVATNRRHYVNLKFILNRGVAAQMPIELYTALRELPIAEERSAYVEKRIASWEGYLRIQELNADVADVTTAYTNARVTGDFTKLQVICSQLPVKQIREINGFSAKVTGLSGDIGNVTHVNPSKKMIEITLSRKFQQLARSDELNIHRFQEVTFNNFAELSQVRRLRKGFKDLQDGLAANANLEKILFEERPVVRISNVKKELEFHNRLNEFQKEAVTGAMTAHDLYVIQGPPGTGKTTVISEICYQNAKAGLRTLVASQANLAVDNALGRLLEDQDIRILRYGRTESIEEEGKKFIEENVADYWKEQTISSIKEELNQHGERKQQLKKALYQYENELLSAQETVKQIEQKIKEKKQAQFKHNELQTHKNELKNEKKEAYHKQTRAQEQKQQLERERLIAVEQIAKNKNILAELELATQDLASIESRVSEIQAIEQAIDYKETSAQIEQIEEQVILLKGEQTTAEERLQQLEHFLEKSMLILKFIEFQAAIKKYDISIGENTAAKINELEQLIVKIKEKNSASTYDVWHAVDQRILKAIDAVDQTLKQQGFSSNLAERNLQRRMMSPKELNGFLDRLGRFLIDPKTKKLFSTRHYSAERYDAVERLATSHVILKQQQAFIRVKYSTIEAQQRMNEQAKYLFETIKKESIETANQLVNQTAQSLKDKVKEIEALNLKQDELQHMLATLQVPIKYESHPISTLQEEVVKLQNDVATYEHKQQAIQGKKVSLQALDKQVVEFLEKIEQTTSVIHDNEAKAEQLRKELLEIDKQSDELRVLVESQPEEDYKVWNQQIDKIKASIHAAQDEQNQLPVKETLQRQWLAMLESATDYDLEEIKKLYIEHANVIGTTCVASARRDFMEDYPTFDVVIIDEVSKATPPELLLPMLKGKKIILVGDHHQLPPLIGQETMEEFLEESSSSAEKKELEGLLKESLFERLFRTLPKQNKTMLAIQYRMHEKIMDTITPFYKEDNYALQCGLENSNLERNHLLETVDFNEENHLLWFDSPNEKSYFEQRVKGGTSRYNEAELSQIKLLLLRLNEATEQAIVKGKLQPGQKKHVGVISFYGEQVKRIDRLIQHELHLPHLHCRTGSVDKFQGMEMDVIILSFVRNHDHPSGDIGFARDYRRLNVALSRARELLMIVGSSAMFTKRPKNSYTKAMFTQLLEEVKGQNGWRALNSEVK